jgi:hypothetical protein
MAWCGSFIEKILEPVGAAGDLVCEVALLVLSQQARAGRLGLVRVKTTAAKYLAEKAKINRLCQE